MVVGSCKGGNAMEEYRERIKKYISISFEPGTIIKCEDFPLLPGGVRVFDNRDQECVFYFDLLSERLYCTGPDDPNSKQPPLCVAYAGEW